MARTKKYDPNEVAKQLNEFIDANDNPLIKKFCLDKDKPCYDTMYELSKTNKELSDAIKRAISKQEVFIEENASTGKMNPTFAIFKLKQHQFGWRDKQEIENSGDMNINVTWSEEK